MLMHIFYHIGLVRPHHDSAMVGLALYFLISSLFYHPFLSVSFMYTDVL
jgi:hypothetical protein